MATKKTVYFVRHGQSEDNAAPVFQGYDSPLSEKGKKQAEQIAERAAHLTFDVLLASPQTRAYQTAEAISAVTKKEIETSELFIERFKPTSLNGKPWTDKEASKKWDAWEASMTTPGLKVEDGENFEEIVGRADKALDYLLNRPEERLLVVSHGYFIRTMVARVLLGENLTGEIAKRFYERTSVENTAITVLNYRDAYSEDFCWRLWSLNDHAHFAE